MYLSIVHFLTPILLSKFKLIPNVVTLFCWKLCLFNKWRVTRWIHVFFYPLTNTKLHRIIGVILLIQLIVYIISHKLFNYINENTGCLKTTHPLPPPPPSLKKIFSMPKSKIRGLKRVWILENNFNCQIYFRDITIFEMYFIKTWDYRNCKPKTLGQSNKNEVMV